MSGKIVVVGFVTVAQRRAPADLPKSADFAPCDVLDAASLRTATADAAQVVASFGFRV